MTHTATLSPEARQAIALARRNRHVAALTDNEFLAELRKPIWASLVATAKHIDRKRFELLRRELLNQ